MKNLSAPSDSSFRIQDDFCRNGQVHYRSPYQDLRISKQPLAEFVFAQAGQRESKTAIIDGLSDRTLTYGEVARSVRQTAAGLVAHGLHKGDVCAIYSPNTPEYVVAFFGVIMAGGVITTVNPLYTVTELTHQLRDSKARFLITTPQLSKVAKRAAAAAGIEEVFAFGAGVGVTRFHTLARNADTFSPPRIDPRTDLAVLPYSSGTTGLPKGVMLTHHNLVTNSEQFAAVERMSADEILVAILPFYHIYGMLVLMHAALRAGATIVTMPRFRTKAFLKILERHRVTTAYLVPPLVRMLATHPLVDRYDLSALRHIVSAAAPLPETIALACANRLDCSVRQAYGMTEASPFTHVTPRDAIRTNAVGLAVPNTEFRIVDVARQIDLAPDDLGEVWVRGPQIMKGYLDNPAATGSMIDRQGWMHTGDIGYVDKDGYLYVVDRAKELTKFRSLQYEGHELLRSMVEDIAARRVAARRINFQALLLDSVRESVVAVDFQRRVTFWNKGAEALFGYAPDEVLGEPLEPLIAPISRDSRNRHLLEFADIETSGEWKGQSRQRRQDGSELWTSVVVSTISDSNGRPSGYIAIHRDITDQKAIEQRLRFQAQLLDSVRESVLATDLNGKVTFWGKGAEALFGYSADQALGHDVETLTFPLANTGLSLSAIRDKVVRELSWHAQLPRRRRDGSEFDADIAVAPVRDSDGAAVGLIGIHRDITELRRSQAKIRDSRERLRQLAASLMAIREEERSAISRELHDELGQALTRLRMELHWISEQTRTQAATGRAGSLVPLVGRMLDTVRHISSSLRPPILDDLGLEAAIEWQVQEFGRWSDCRCRLNLQLADLEPHTGRDTAVFRIIQESLTNIARHAQAKQVQIRARTSSTQLMVEIADDGIGVQQDDLTSPRSLGLIGMRERTESMGGHLEIVTAKPVGTTIRVSMPLTPISVADQSDDSPADSGRPPNRARGSEARGLTVSGPAGRRRSARR